MLHRIISFLLNKSIAAVVPIELRRFFSVYSHIAAFASLHSTDINTACKRLLVAALDAGGKDNTTIMMFEVQKKSLFGR